MISKSKACFSLLSEICYLHTFFFLTALYVSLCDAADGRYLQVEKKSYGVEEMEHKARLSALGQRDDNQGREKKVGECQTKQRQLRNIRSIPLHFISLKGRFGNNDPTQIAPMLSATVT